jgi:NADH-quinone oxidoreductase subunit J
VYSAIWFALTLLGTAGLFLYDGAQFLGVATIVVYAGAILVTFLFVLMLAQPEGQAFYDRLSWGALLSAVTGAVMVGVLTLTLAAVFQNPNPEARPEARFDAADLSGDILAREHMAHLGSELFSKYLVGVEVAGTLLLVALVGTVAIVAQIRKPHAGANSDA